MFKRFTIIALVIAVAPLAVLSQQWQYTGSLHQARRILPLTLLTTGSVLANGGYGTNTMPTSECEIYDPAAGQWRVTTPMTSPRARHINILLPDGRVAAIAGQVDGTDYSAVWSNSIEKFDPTTETWAVGDSLLFARQNHTATLLSDSTILISGGWNGDVMASCEIYDYRTGISRLCAPMNVARQDHQAILLNTGEVLVAGGRTGGQLSDYLREVEIYSPSTNSWRVIDSMAQARIIGSLVQFSDGSVLAAGGHNSPTSSAPGSEILDPVSQVWTSTDPMRQPCHWQGEALLENDRYLITGGMIDAAWETSTDVVATATCEWYDKQNSRWYYAPQLNVARTEHGSVHLFQDVNDTLPQNLLLVAGGLGGDSTYTLTSEVLNVGVPALESYKLTSNNLLDVRSHNILDLPMKLEVLGNTSATPEAVFSLYDSRNVLLQLISPTGVVIDSRDYPMLTSGEYHVPLEISGLPDGFYFVRLSNGTSMLMSKLVVIK